MLQTESSPEMKTFPSAPPPLYLWLGGYHLVHDYFSCWQCITTYISRQSTFQISPLSIIWVINLCYVFTPFYKNTFSQNIPCILCKVSCILYVTYKYITRILSSLIALSSEYFLQLLHFYTSSKKSKAPACLQLSATCGGFLFSIPPSAL